jgi:hypothetical protein
MLKAQCLSVLSPEKIEVLNIEWINTMKNKVESTMRLRALAEISRHMDTESLISLSAHVSKFGGNGVQIRCG